MAPFPTPEESTEIQSENKQANQLGLDYRHRRVAFLVFVLFWHFSHHTDSHHEGNNNYLYNFLNEVFAYTPLMPGL